MQPPSEPIPPASVPGCPGGMRLTVIIVGVHCPGADRFAGLAEMRTVFPDATYVLSTSRAEARAAGDLSQFDRVLIQESPGLISSDKFHHASTEINQIRAYAQAALAECGTRLAVLLRPGSYLFSAKALDLWQAWSVPGPRSAPDGPGRILVSKFFTINPRYDERLPFQVSTTFQLGRAADLLRYWSGPEYDFATATWYEGRPHARGSLPRERAFRARFTPDQWMALHYLYPSETFPIEYHNDVSVAAMAEFETMLARHFIVAHPRDIDLHDAETIGLYFNTYVNMLCYSYWEWARWAEREQGTAPDFPTHRFWPREPWQRQAVLFARTKLSRRLLGGSGLLSKKLLRQIYD